jgi:hypothetical protein
VDSPWLHRVDPVALAADLDAVRRIEPNPVLSSHLPAAPGSMTERLLGSLETVPTADPLVGPEQIALEQLLIQTSTGGPVDPDCLSPPSCDFQSRQSDIRAKPRRHPQGCSIISPDSPSERPVGVDSTSGPHLWFQGRGNALNFAGRPSRGSSGKIGHRQTRGYPHVLEWGSPQ